MASKTATKAAIRALPALRTSLLWYKREIIRALTRKSTEVASSKLAAVYRAKVAKVRATDLADLRAHYQAERVTEIVGARRFELAGIVWMCAL